MGLLDEEVVTIAKKIHPRGVEARANKLLKNKKTRRAKRKKHKLKIPFMTYRMYMGSAYWKRRKNQYFSKYGKQCAVCGKKYGVTLHHKKYDNKMNGKEPDNFFVALCGKHHHEFHTNHELSKNMVKETNIYVHTMKQVEDSNINDLSWI